MTDQEAIRLLAEKVMVWKIDQVHHPYGYRDVGGGGVWWREDWQCWAISDNGYRRWNPLTNIADAWMVLRVMAKREEKVTFFCELAAGTSGPGNFAEWTPLMVLGELADRFPQAVCDAALRTIGEKVK